MSTTPATPAKAPNKFWTVFDDIADGIRKFQNAAVNIAIKITPSMSKILPVWPKLIAIFSAGAAQIDAQWEKVDAENLTGAAKAKAIATLVGPTVIAVLAENGVVATQGAVEAASGYFVQMTEAFEPVAGAPALTSDITTQQAATVQQIANPT